MRYMIERVDVSSCWVEAESEEDALAIANDEPDIWEICIGKPCCVETEETWP